MAEMDSDPMYLSFLSPLLQEFSGLFTTILLFFWPHQAASGIEPALPGVEAKEAPFFENSSRGASQKQQSHLTRI